MTSSRECLECGREFAPAHSREVVCGERCRLRRKRRQTVAANERIRKARGFQGGYHSDPDEFLKPYLLTEDAAFFVLTMRDLLGAEQTLGEQAARSILRNGDPVSSSLAPRERLFAQELAELDLCQQRAVERKALADERSAVLKAERRVEQQRKKEAA